MAGLHATIGVLAALRARDDTGSGQRVDVSLMSSLLSSLVNQASSYVTAGVVPQRLGNRHPSIAPYETFEAADGTLALAVGNDTQFARLCGALGLPALPGDERFATNAARVANRGALAVALSTMVCTRPVAHWTTALTAVGVPSGPVNDMAQAFALASELGLAPVETLERSDGSSVPTVASPLGLSATPVSYRLAPPQLGEGAPDVLAWLNAAIAGGGVHAADHE